MAAPPAPAGVVSKAHGFTLTRQQYVKEYGSHVLMYTHDKTGGAGVRGGEGRGRGGEEEGEGEGGMGGMYAVGRVRWGEVRGW